MGPAVAGVVWTAVSTHSQRDTWIAGRNVLSDDTVGMKGTEVKKMSNSGVWRIDGAGIGHQLRRRGDDTKRWRTWCGLCLGAATEQPLDDPERRVGDLTVVPCRNCAAEVRIAGIAAKEIAHARRLLSRSAA